MRNLPVTLLPLQPMEASGVHIFVVYKADADLQTQISFHYCGVHIPYATNYPPFPTHVNK